MADKSFLAWPFFEERHRELADEARGLVRGDDPRRAGGGSGCRMPGAGRASSARRASSSSASATATTAPTCAASRIARETFARAHGLADFAFAMQGLGSGAISLFGTVEQKREWLPKVASGEAIAAFAMTEPECGSDAANMATSAMRDGNEWVLVGEKTLHLQRRHRRLLRDLRAHRRRRRRARPVGLHRARRDAVTVAERIEVIAPHPLARLKYDNVRIPADAIIGEPGEGFRIGMETLNLFRVTVGAAALGFARRALDEALSFATDRRLGSGTLADNAVTQAKLADMALRSMPRRCSSTAPPGSRTSAGPTTAAPRRWPSSTRPKPRSR